MSRVNRIGQKERQRLIILRIRIRGSFKAAAAAMYTQDLAWEWELPGCFDVVIIDESHLF
jgi:hypothetical protein